MIKQLFAKWFGLDISCQSCELLKDQLERVSYERKELLDKLLKRDEPIVKPAEPAEEFRPITPQHVPWRVRQQMLEAEDRRSSQILRQRTKEIDELEREMGIAKDVSSASGGVKVQVE